MEPLYREYPPSPHLSAFVECYWSFLSDSGYIMRQHRPVIPDGCVDLIWSLDGPDCPCSLVGPMTSPFFNNSENLFGLRFRPFAPSFFLKMPLHDLCDQKISTTDMGRGSWQRFPPGSPG